MRSTINGRCVRATVPRPVSSGRASGGRGSRRGKARRGTWRCGRGTVPRLLALLVLTVGWSATAGCGAVFLPEASERPAPALRTVEVVDAVSGEPVTTADIVVVGVPWDDPRCPPPWIGWGVAPSAESAIRRLTPDTDPADVPRSRPSRHLGQGRYEVAPQQAWLWQQVVWPLGEEDKPVIHHGRQAHLVVSAPEYRTVWVSDPWTASPDERPPVRYEFGPSKPAQPGPRVRLTEAGLQVALPPRSLPTRGPAWRWDRPTEPADETPPPADDREKTEDTDE